MRTEMVRKYIIEKFLVAREQNKKYIDLYARDIHKKMGFENRYPIVCNAMQQMMTGKDMYLSETDSCQSSSIAIRYYLDEKENCIVNAK